ncbi:MAG: LptA/OstA family protein [Pseudomonadales bacterium]
MSRPTHTILMLALLSCWGAVGSAADSETETIIIRADRAWEEEDDREVLHFKGDFELIAPDWQLNADEADLFGPMDDPDRILARGAPAVVLIVSDEETIRGEGDEIEYLREADVLTLRGNAELKGEKLFMKSNEIVYDVGTERLKSSGDQGVEMILERDAR